MDQQKKERVSKFCVWISGGALSTSLAFILFLPGQPLFNNIAAQFAMAFFLVSVPMLTFSLFIEKGIDDHQEGSTKRQAKLAIYGGLFVLFGFSLVILALGNIYFLVFALATIITHRYYDKGVKKPLEKCDEEPLQESANKESN